jgi:DivIVA domain-containing protein
MSTVEFTSDVVRTIKFREKMRGYHPEEVDAFLERAAAALELLQTRLAEATERALKAETALESNSAADESIRRTLMLAQRTAELAVSEANEEAQRIRDEAQTAVDGQSSETEAACAALLGDASADAEKLRTEAEETLSAAQAAAAATTAAADQQSEDRRLACDEAINAAERESAERIEAAREGAETAQAAEADRARRELETIVGLLGEQRYELRAQVEALSQYLAAERARVLETLSTALEGFGASLSRSPAPALVDVALHGDPVPTPTGPGGEETSSDAQDASTDRPAQTEEALIEASIDSVGLAPDPIDAGIQYAEGNEPAPQTAIETDKDWSWAQPTGLVQPLPEGDAAPEISNADALGAGPAAVWFREAVGQRPAEGEQDPPSSRTEDAVPDQPAPSTLLFTLGDDLHRDSGIGEVDAAEEKPRKSLLGRRRI